MTRAFFISPAGDLVPVPTSHIAAVIADPSHFGVTRAFIEARHQHYNEPLGSEGHARDEVLLQMLDASWIRIREQPPKEPVRWHVQLAALTDGHRARLQQFAQDALRGGTEHFPQPEWCIDPVVVMDGTRATLWRGTLAGLAAAENVPVTL